MRSTTNDRRGVMQRHDRCPSQGSARAAALVLVGVLCVTGCATDPAPTTKEIQDAALANVAMPEDWVVDSTDGGVADDWLATFGDPQLNELVVEALLNNPDLRASATRVALAAQYVAVAEAALLPSVGLFGTGGLNMGGGDISSALQGISLGVSWEPDLWGRLRYGRNAAEEQFASVRADFEFGRQSLAATVARSWFTASETWIQQQLTNEMVGTARDLLAIAETRRTVGPGNEQDVALARANLANLEDMAEQVSLAHGQAVRALELLLGRYPRAELQARQDLAELPGKIPAGLPLQMLERRPDLVAAERRVAAAFNRVGEAKAARLPRITLNASVAAIDSEILQLQDDFSNPTGGVGARLIAPIYEGGALDAQVAIRTIEQEEAVAQYARAALRALGDVENGLAASKTLATRKTMLERSLVDSERAWVLAQESYRVGRTDLRPAHLQQINVQTARLALLRVRSEELSQRVQLHLALGGSFEQPPTEETAPAESAESAD